MKKFTRVLAMLIALVMVLAVLPISAIADTWLNVEAEKETNDNVTTTDVTVTVTPYGVGNYADAVVENDYTVYAFAN